MVAAVEAKAAIGSYGDGARARARSVSPLLPQSPFCNSSYGAFRMLDLPCQVPFSSSLLPPFTFQFVTQLELHLQSLWRRLNHRASSTVHLGSLPIHSGNFQIPLLFILLNSSYDDCIPLFWLIDWFWTQC